MTKSPQNDPEMQAFQDAKLITWTSLCLQRWHNFFNRLYVPNLGLENSTPTEEQRVDRLDLIRDTAMSSAASSCLKVPLCSVEGGHLHWSMGAPCISSPGFATAKAIQSQLTLRHCLHLLSENSLK